MCGRRPAWNPHPLLRRMVWGLGAGGILLALWLVGSAAHAALPTLPGDPVTLTFSATIQSGTMPGDVLFWLCADPQPDGTGCFQMSRQSDNSFTYQLASATGITYHRLEIAWTRGTQAGATTTPAAPAPSKTPTAPSKTPTAQPSAPVLPALPLHILCSYPELTVAGPKSFTCLVDAALFTTTPTPGAVDPVPSSQPTNPAPPTIDRDTATLITGLQIVIGVGLVLLVILIPILIWQRIGRRRR